MTQTVGQYELRDLLGEGGIGQVHAAFDTVLQREVAMKSLRPELLSDSNFADRFRAEATSLARLNHPNITTLFSLIPDGKNLYMVMERVRGHTLDDILAKRNAPLAVSESLAIISQAADGLAYAHSMGVIHRDIKPSNLMIAENGVLKIMDFGIARVRGSQRLTRTGSIVGTLSYMAPEQLRGEEGDEACDIYSLAIVLYELLTGAPPFSANSEYDLMQAQINQKPDRLIARVPGLDSRVDAAIMKALSKKPAQRFPSTRAFSDALGASAMRMDAPKILHNDTRLIETPANPIQIAPPRRSVFDRLPNVPGLAPELRAAVYGGGAAAVVDLGEELQLPDARGTRDGDLGIGVHREGHHAIDIVRPQAGVVDRGLDCLAGELELAAAGLLRELGLADSGDGRHSTQPTHVSASFRLSVAVPDTCSPRLLVPLNTISAKPSPSSPPDLPVTLPVKRSGSLGNAGTPNRIDNFVTIASGPAQSVRNRTHSPLVVRMFMNRLGEPCLLAKSRSWCTGMKSRDAIAPATMTVVVTGISRGVTSSPTLMSRQASVVVRYFAAVIALLLRTRRPAGPTAERPNRA